MVDLASRGGVAQLVTDAFDQLSCADTVDDLLERYPGIAAAAVPVRRFDIHLFPAGQSSSVVSAAEGASDLFLTRYEATGRDRDPVLKRVVSSGTVVHSAHLMNTDTWQELEIYRDMLALHKMRMVLEAPVMVGSKVVGTLNVGDHDPTRLAAPSDNAIAATLGRVVGAIVSSLYEQHELKRERDHARAALDLTSEALVVTELEFARRGAGHMGGMT